MHLRLTAALPPLLLLAACVEAGVAPPVADPTPDAAAGGDATVPPLPTGDAGDDAGHQHDGDRDGGRDGQLDAGSDPCPNGEVVPSSAHCLQDDAFCFQLPDGSYCTGPAASTCPIASAPVAPGFTCPDGDLCFDYAEGLRCHTRRYTVAACTAAGGQPVSDPGDGSVVAVGCPGGRAVLGSIHPSEGWDEGGLCCESPAPPTPPADPACAPQWAHVTGACRPVAVYYWNGQHCEARSGCQCTGPDCQDSFATEQGCQLAHASCKPTACGARLGDSCGPQQYCAYQPPALCGAADATATCAAIPSACPKLSDPVCGCDGQPYPNPCEAARADTGIARWGACK